MKIDDYQVNVITDRQKALAMATGFLLLGVEVPEGIETVVHKGYGYPRITFSLGRRAVLLATRWFADGVHSDMFKIEYGGDGEDDTNQRIRDAKQEDVIDAIEWLKES